MTDAFGEISKQIFFPTLEKNKLSPRFVQFEDLANVFSKDELISQVIDKLFENVQYHIDVAGYIADENNNRVNLYVIETGEVGNELTSLILEQQFPNSSISFLRDFNTSNWVVYQE